MRGCVWGGGFGLGLEYDSGRLWFGGPYRKVKLAFNRCVLGARFWFCVLMSDLTNYLWRRFLIAFEGIWGYSGN